MKISKFKLYMYHYKKLAREAFYQLKETIKLLILPAVFCALMILGSFITFNREVEAFTLESLKTSTMTNLSVKDYIMKEVKASGLNEYEAYMVLLKESHFNTEATLVNKDGSIDRGIWQLNNKHHKEVSNACSFDYKCATREAIRIAKKYGWNEWTAGKQLGLR